MSRELDAEVARKIMGWTEVRLRLMAAGGGWTGYDPLRSLAPLPVPPYSTDISAAMQVEDRIAELGLQGVYSSRLVDIAGGWREGSGLEVLFWNLAHASPEQRCRAALAAVSTQRESGSDSAHVESQGSVQPNLKSEIDL